MSSVYLFCLFLLLLTIPTRTKGAQAPAANTAPPQSAASASNHSANDQYSKEPYVFEKQERNIRFEADGKGQHDLTYAVRIQSESAIHEFGLLVYSYSSSFEALDVLYVRVRRPDGSVIEKLIQTHTIRVKNSHDTDGTAEFWVLLTPGPTVMEIKFISGDESVHPFANDLKTAQLPGRFPDAAEVRLPRRGKLTCSRSTSECIFHLMSAETVHSAN